MLVGTSSCQQALAAIAIGALFGACTEDPASAPELGPGTGAYLYTDYEPLSDKPVEVHYHVPEGADELAPIVVVFHGVERNAAEYRDAWIQQADALGFVIAAPEFTDEHFPGGDYALGGVFDDGDNPAAEELNPPEQWTFSIVERLVEHFAARIGNLSSIYHVFGHSAGAQFAHRLVLFRPEGRYGYVMAANAGWYTVPDDTVAFPYGLGGSPLEGQTRSFFEARLTIHAGTNDNDPASPLLRRSPEANAQGAHRLDRARYFVQQSELLARGGGQSFVWSLTLVEGVGHSQTAMADHAAEWLADALKQ